MHIEITMFEKTKVNFMLLEAYGFKKEADRYTYSKNFMNDTFRADIIIDKNGNISGTVFDNEMEEEYTTIQIKNTSGSFVNYVKQEYQNILEDIKKNCFEKMYFTFPQANRITSYIFSKYKNEPEFLWEKFTSDGIFRNHSGKWFGLIMKIDKSKLGIGSGSIEILNIKIESSKIQEQIKREGFYKAYHMNKNNWITVVLDDTISDDVNYELIDNSYNLTE